MSDTGDQFCAKCGCGCDTFDCPICAACDRGEFDDPAYTRMNSEEVEKPFVATPVDGERREG